LREPDLSGTAASSIFLRAHLPQDKQEALAALDEVIANFSDKEEKALHARRASMLSV
jgi:phosphotransferase system HPr-like phosphotransfer protein